MSEPAETDAKRCAIAERGRQHEETIRRHAERGELGPLVDLALRLVRAETNRQLDLHAKRQRAGRAHGLSDADLRHLTRHMDGMSFSEMARRLIELGRVDASNEEHLARRISRARRT